MQDGKVAWVCEHCGSENSSTPASTDPAATSAQTVVDQAAASVAPAAPTASTDATAAPVATTDSASPTAPTDKPAQ